MNAQFTAGAAVRVVAETLANGAPHPLAGCDGIVLEVRDIGRFPVRVQVDGRPVMFAAAELARVVHRVNPDDRAEFTPA